MGQELAGSGLMEGEICMEGSFRELVTERIVEKLIKKFELTYPSWEIAQSFDITCCSLPCKFFSVDFDVRRNIKDRLKHWKIQHSDLKLRWVDCAWIIGGGLVKWQTLKSQHGKKLLEINNTGRWSLAEIEQFINGTDLTPIIEREQQTWEQLEQKVQQNAREWNARMPEKLVISQEECCAERLHLLNSLELEKQFYSWVRPIVDATIPDELSDNYADNEVFDFLRNDSNRQWLANLFIHKPYDLWWRVFEWHETWEEYFDSFSAMIVTSHPPQPKFPEIEFFLDRLEILHSNESIIYSNIHQTILFFLSQIYNYWGAFCHNEIIKIIATPNCNALELHELILENCHKQYDIDQIPKTISRARRMTWGLLDNLSIWGTGGLIVIANAHNLTVNAIQEIEDLNTRCATSFWLGFDSKATHLPSISEMTTLNIPVVQQFFSTIKKLRENNVSLEDAVRQVLSNCVSVEE